MEYEVDPREVVAGRFFKQSKMDFLHVNASINMHTVDTVASQIAGEKSGQPLFVLLSPPAQQSADNAVPEFLDLVTETYPEHHVCCPVMVRGIAVAIGLSGKTLHITPTTRFGDSVWGHDWTPGFDASTRLWEGEEYKKRILRRALLRCRPDLTDRIMSMMCFPQKDHDVYHWPYELGIDVRFADPTLMEVMSATGVAEMEPFIHFISANCNKFSSAH